MPCITTIGYNICHFSLPKHTPTITAMTQYGWKRENGKLTIHWEVTENVERAKVSLDFVLNGCKCKTGCKTRLCSCKKKERKCGPSCACHFCTNITAHIYTCSSDVTDLVVDELLQEDDTNIYVEDSEDDLEEWRQDEMDADEELKTLMEFVFGSDSDQEDP